MGWGAKSLQQQPADDRLRDTLIQNDPVPAGPDDGIPHSQRQPTGRSIRKDYACQTEQAEKVSRLLLIASAGNAPRLPPLARSARPPSRQSARPNLAVRPRLALPPGGRVAQRPCRDPAVTAPAAHDPSDPSPRQSCP